MKAGSVLSIYCLTDLRNIIKSGLCVLLVGFSIQLFSQDTEETKRRITEDNYQQILNLPFSGSSFYVPNNDRWPMYINGMEGLDEFLKEKITYPEKAVSNGIEGTVVFDYVITSKGKITDIRISESPDDLLSNEVIRVMKLSGPWIPGIIDNNYKSMRMSKSFNFKI